MQPLFHKSECLIYLADGDNKDWKDKHSQGHPGHISFKAPGPYKVSPTFIDAWCHL